MVSFRGVPRPGLKIGPAGVGGLPRPPIIGAPLNLQTGSRLPGPVHDREGYRPMAQSNTPSTPSRTSANDEAHWRKTTNLMLIHLGIWVFFGYIIHMFVKPLNRIVIPILDFPLGFYMAAQGSLIVFVVMLFMFAKQQNKIDREFGVAEDE
jgi:putative solute:sodium symporter small subunit